jgi:AraC-like DNA-binding protein
MPGCGTRTFVDPDDYAAHLRRAQIELTIVSRGEFKARLTWAELHHLRLLRSEEDLPRIAFLSLPPRLVFVAFPSGSRPPQLWGGAELHAGDVMLHRLGQGLHQVTTGPSVWGLIALEPAQLEHYSRLLSGKPLSRAQQGWLRPTSRDAARLRRLHAQTCRLVETKPRILTHPEVARAIEETLIQALVTCLTRAKVQQDRAIKRRHARIMVRFEEELAEHLGEPLRIVELCKLIGVSELTLRSCCTEFLGVSPGGYVLLRRLNRVRAALCNADPKMVNLAELARHSGFARLERFAVAYRAVFGETPSETLRRRAEKNSPAP